MSLRVVFITTPPGEADKVADALLNKKLCACVNIVETVKSKYWWKGKIESDGESLLIVKTTEEQMDNLISEVKDVHSYDVPEVISLEVKEGNPDYLQWAVDSVQKGSDQ